MESININNNIPQFGTPHSGGRISKIKLILILLIILGSVVFNLWYYFGFFSNSPVAVVPEAALPPSDEEKITIASDLENRVAEIANNDKAKMIQSLVSRMDAAVEAKDRDTAVKSFSN